ncbi:hypothetical protein AMR72_16030 [Flavobacterium psychrophilum]|nr:hypothetical protein AMR72_16030 [Flavobacterium psychrophilum]AOE53880.1 hypothetical protein ALW18_16020 [Flavobacterium psychrophilum]
MKYNKEQYYRNIKEQLIGATIAEVYYEIVYLDEEASEEAIGVSTAFSEWWELSRNIHSIDMNIIFKLDNGRLVQILWDYNFDYYGLGIEVREELNYQKAYKLINVTDNDNVSKIIGNKIKDILVSWDPGPTPLGIGEADIPLVWQIVFEEPFDMWIAAFELRDDNHPLYYMDHLTVFFDRNDLERYKFNCENIVSINTITK